MSDRSWSLNIFGTLAAEDIRRLLPLVSGAFQLRDTPLTTLTLAFNEAATIAVDDAVVATREALGDALAVCAEQNAALRIVAPPALRRLSTTGLASRGRPVGGQGRRWSWGCHRRRSRR